MAELTVEEFQKLMQERTERLYLQQEKSILNKTISLEYNYKQAQKQIRKEVEALYGRYAKQTGLDITTVRKQLSKEELKSFKQSLKDIAQYAKEHEFDKDYRKQIKALSLKSRVSRLEELNTNIEFEIEKLHNSVTNEIGDILGTAYEEGYYKTIFNTQSTMGFGTSFTTLNKAAIEKAVSTPFMKENYKYAMLKNKTKLQYIVEATIPQGIILGKNPETLAKDISAKLDTSYRTTKRLIRTEYNLILNDATAQGYKQCGIDKYEILATLDSRTSDICQAMDGKVFNLSEKEVGINYPPFHANCRTTTVPYFEPDEFDKDNVRLAKGEDGQYYEVPANMTYKQWKEKYVEGGNK